MSIEFGIVSLDQIVPPKEGSFLLSSARKRAIIKNALKNNENISLPVLLDVGLDPKLMMHKYEIQGGEEIYEIACELEGENKGFESISALICTKEVLASVREQIHADDLPEAQEQPTKMDSEESDKKQKDDVPQGILTKTDGVKLVVGIAGLRKVANYTEIKEFAATEQKNGFAYKEIAKKLFKNFNVGRGFKGKSIALDSRTVAVMLR